MIGAEEANLVALPAISSARPSQHRGRVRQVERPGGLEVDSQLELRRLLDRQIGGLGRILST